MYGICVGWNRNSAFHFQNHHYPSVVRVHCSPTCTYSMSLPLIRPQMRNEWTVIRRVFIAHSHKDNANYVCERSIKKSAKNARKHTFPYVMESLTLHISVVHCSQSSFSAIGWAEELACQLLPARLARDICKHALRLRPNLENRIGIDNILAFSEFVLGTRQTIMNYGCDGWGEIIDLHLQQSTRQVVLKVAIFVRCCKMPAVDNSINPNRAEVNTEGWEEVSVEKKKNMCTAPKSKQWDAAVMCSHSHSASRWIQFLIWFIK